MSDLISRSALIKKLESMSSDNDVRNNSHQFTYKELVYIICNQPTAYDVDKVVEELKEKLTCEDCGTCGYCQNTWCPMELLDADEAIDIVRKGGAE